MPRKKTEWIGRTPDSKPPKSALQRILKRSEGKCACCGCVIVGTWHCDHIKPLEDGGENRESNMQPLLPACHFKKTGQENSRRAKADRIASKANPVADRKTVKIKGNPDGLKTGNKRKKHPIEALPPRRLFSAR